jgi:D-sedoheptulose 7-phosphate isomerase
MGPLCDLLLAIPDTDTPRIQECHMLMGHTVCEIVEAQLFPR